MADKQMKTFKQFCNEGYVSHAQRKAVWASRNDEKEKKKKKNESLRKDIATLSGKFKEGSTVTRKKDGKKGKVVSVGKDYVKVAYGNRMVDHKPSDIFKEEQDPLLADENPVTENGQDAVDEATYKGKKVPLNKPMKGDVKKSKVFVDPDGDGKAQKVNFGDKNSSIKKNIPARKKSYCARSGGIKGGGKDKTKANYWSRKAWDC